MDRAYSLLTLKSVDEDRRILTGLATTPTTDRVGDVVESEGAVFELPIPFLWQHNSDQPIGHVTKAKVTKSGIEVEVHIQKTNEPGPVKDRLDGAWQDIKLGLVRGLSIGFSAIEFARIADTYCYRYIKWLWLELSGVTIPANGDCNIQTIKSIDTTIRAATGIKDGEGRPVSPGKSGSRKTSVPLPKEGNKMSKSIGQQIADLEASRGAKAARAEEIMTKASTAGRSTAADEQEEFDTLDGEIGALDADITRLKSLEKMQARKAKAVADIRDQDDGTRARASVEIVRQPPVDKGIQFARYVRCMALGRFSVVEAEHVAKQYYPNDDKLGRMFKTAVPGATTTGTYWAGPLVPDEVTTAIADFVDYLRPKTILGQFGQNGVPALRSVPFYTPLLTEQAIPSAGWVGEGKGFKVSKGGFTRTTLTPLKLGAIAVVTMELLKRSSPSADALIRDQLTKAIAAKLDGDFIDPAVTASAGVSPASVTQGVSANHSSGNTADDVRADIETLIDVFLNADNQLGSGVFIMPTRRALRLSLMRNAMGGKEFPDISMKGGFLEGIPVIASEYVPAVTAGDRVVLANAEDIYLGDDGGVEVDASREASLEMTDAPSMEVVTPTESATNTVSLWQTESVGIKASRAINWAKRRAHAVQLLDQVAWGDASA